MEEKYYSVLEFLSSNRDGRIYQEQILDSIEDLDSADLNFMSNTLKWINRSHVRVDDGTRRYYYSIRPDGAQILNSKKLQDEIDSLRKFERKSAAVETLFTIVLVMFGISQVIGQFYSSKGMKIYESMIILGAFLTGYTVILLSLQIGWENLWKTIKSETVIGRIMD